MRHFFTKRSLIFSGVVAATVFGFAIGSAALAQISIDYPTSFAGFSSQDIKETIENIVRIVLGFIGVIFLLLILYGGFTWMTSQGEQDKVNRAKKMIAAAVIGLLVTLASYSIASFIIGTLQQAVSPGPPGPPGICGNGIVEPGEQCDGQPGCTGLCVWLPGVNGQCMSTPPAAGVVKICSVIGGSQSGGVMRIYGHNFGAYLPGESKVFLNSGTAGPGGDVAEAQVISCGGSIVWNSGYIEAITPTVTPGPYQVVVQADLDGTAPFDDRCDGGVQETPLYPPGDCQPVSVQAGSAPVLYCITPASAPNDNNSATNPTITLDGKNLGSTAGTVEMQGDASLINITGAAVQSWDDTQIVYTKPDDPLGTPTLITGDVAVIDSSAVRSSNTKLFTVTCSAPSSTSAECATGCCTASLQCQPATVCATTPPGGAPGDPFITGLSPDNGEEGTYVTITGRNFGANPGTVSYKQPSGTWVTIVSPYVSNPSCTSNWSDTQIIFEVPQDAGTPNNSPPDVEVYVRNVVIGRDSNHVAFTQNDIIRPGLCRVDPTSGYYQTPFDLYGNNFASTLSPNDYVAYWKFDDAAGTIATDSSINNHDGALSCKGATCTLPQWTPGKVGGALTFDGVDDYVNLGDLSAHRHPLTISFWYYLPETNLPGVFFLGNASSSTVYPYYVIHPRDGGSLHFYYPDYGASQNILSLSPRWLHIAYVTDPTSLGNWKTYLNGVLQTNTYTETGIPVNFDAAGTYLGGSNIAPDHLKGSIDELRIYDRALSGSEITQVMQSAPSDIYFGSPTQKVSANNQDFSAAPTGASATVPNISPTNTTVAVNVDGQDSNPLGFTVRGTASGDPIVTSINPNSGPTGTYVTILGSNFGTQQGSVYFARQTVTSCPQRTFDGVTRFACLADTNFPPICSTDVWRNDRIVVKVPSGLQGLVGYFLIVQRLDGKASQTSAIQGVNASFVRNAAPLTPGVCRVDPLGGPEGTPVRYDGENFGLGIGTVRFDMNRSSAPSLWNWRQAIGPVPVGSVTGSTSVASQSGLFSNRLPFFVGSCTSNTQCGSGFCCTGICRPTAQCSATNTGETRWSFVTEELPFDLEDSVACTLGIQSPTPYPYDQVYTLDGDPATNFDPTDLQMNAPLDSDIAGLFTRPLNYQTVWDGTTANIKIVTCNAGPTFTGPCSASGIAGTFTQVGSNGWKFDPTAPLAQSTWYEVRLDDNGLPSSLIRAQDGSGYKGSAFLDPTVGSLASFRWHFRTRAAGQPLCDVSDVRLSPSAMTVNVNNTSGWMTALPISAQCYICGNTGYQYSWAINPNPVAPNQYANFSPVSPPTSYQTQFFGVNVTTGAVPPYSNVTATINNPPSGAPITSSVPAQLTVDYLRPRVIRSGPSGACSRICQNSLAFADFNVSLLSPDTISPTPRVRIYRCSQPNCTGLLSSTHSDMTFSWPPSFATVRNPNDRIEFTSAAFQTNTWYRVVVQGTVSNTQNQSLDPASYNYDTNGDGTLDAYSWYFQTSDTQCQPDYAEVLPNPGAISAIGGKLGFSSSIWSNSFLGVPGCDSIPLNPNGFDWEWSVANVPQVYATITTNGRCSNNAALSCTTDPVCGSGNQCIGSHRQTATGVSANCAPPPGVCSSTVVVAAIQGSWITPSADLYVSDTREPIALIGHRPDEPPGSSPPEDQNGTCNLDQPFFAGAGDPAQCVQWCTNIMTSAIFSTHLNTGSFNYYTIPGTYAGYYSFNQESTADESGNGNHGTMQNFGAVNPFTEPSASTALRKSITFDGIDDYVSVGDAFAFELDNQNLTITFWVKSDSLPTTAARSVISKGKVFNMSNPSLGNSCGTVANMGWEVIQMADRYRFGTCSNATFDYADTSTFSTNDDQWHFIAITFNRNTQRMRITVDGIQTVASAFTNTNPNGEVNNLCFGSRCGSYFFKGSLDDIRIYRHNSLAWPAELPFSDSVLQQIRLEGYQLQVPPLNFHVVEYPSGVLVPGTVKVTNYTEVSGLCEDSATSCTNNDDCLFLAAWGFGTTCTLTNNKRGRVDFYPQLGSNYVIPSDFTSYYSFNDSTARDSSINNFSGVLSTSPAPTLVGPNADYSKLGLGMGFLDPSVNSSDYVAIGDVSALDIGTGSMSIAFWAQSQAPASAFIPPEASIPISKGAANAGCTGTGNMGYEVRQFADRYNFNICYHTGASGTTASVNSPNFVTTDGKWHHIVAVLNRSQSTVQMFVDGVAGPTSPANFASNNIDASSPLYFGGRYLSAAATNHSFNGSLDEIYIYKRALSTAEVDSIYRSSAGQKRVNGVYEPGKAYQAQICPNDSCLVKPIKSSQGVPFTDSYVFGFTAGDTMCKISYLDINPNPAEFINREMECRLPDPTFICKDATPKTLTAQAKDARGVDLSLVTYTWRETIEYAGPYSSTYYELDQPTAADTADIRHKGKLGIDYAQVTAESSDPLVNLGKVSEQALLNFSFCQNPWLGDAANNTYYLDVPYDLKLAYCRDTDSAAALLPNLPNPHVERTSPGFGQGGDLLKEHVFVVGTQTGGTSNISDQPPYYTVPSNSPAVSLPGFTATSYFKYGDLVSFTLKAKDPDGDNFQFVMQNDTGESDTVPASASFNPKTGAFIWVIDKLPATDSDGDGKNDFALRFTLNPAGAAPNEYARVVIDVESITTPAPVDYPVTRFTAPPEGSTITANYGQTVSFSAVVDSYGAGTSVKSFVWDFQDSGLSTYTNTAGPYSANHVFLQQGQHQVTFRVQNNLNVWSLPATVNVYVLPKTSLKPSESRIASEDGGVRALFSQWAKAFVGTALGQSFSQPSQLTANSVGTAPDIELRWKNNGTYASITIYRDGSVLASGLPGGSTIYTDPGVAVGTTYLYRVCGVIGTQSQCEQVTVTARNVSYDVIIARVYKNLDSFSVTEWYKAYAPNPIGAPKPTQIDGYDAIVDGTSVYIGVANCTVPSNCDSSGSNGIYTNVLLLSYNQGAKSSTVEIFNRLLADLRINENLVTRDDGSTTNTCSEDGSVICDPGHDAVCAAKNAGLCQSAKAELRRDYKRIVDLHDVAGALYTYASQHTFCDDGTNSIACNTDADCPGGNLCVGVYPALTAGSYIGGMSTSKWPSWQQTLAKELGRTDLAHDPIDRFGANFYSSTPARCADLTPAGYDENTCWNERSSQFQCHSGSEVYMYRNVRGDNFNLYGLAEAQNWRWIAQDPKVILNDASYGGICSNTAPVTAVCGNGVIENTPSGDIYVVVNTPRKTTNVSATDIYVGGSGVYNPGDPIQVYDASSQAVITDASAPTNANGLQIQRLLYNGLPRVHVKLQPSSRDYEAVIAIQGGRVRRLVSDHASFGTGSPFGGPGLEKTNGSCFGQSEDRLIAQTPSSVDFCMEVPGIIDQFYIDIDAGRETCDGGTANYCDITFGPANWNNDFKVGCEPTCTAWGDPYSGNLTAARAACGGACGDGTIDAAEQCDPSASPNGAESYSCTGGSTAYCSASCVISCASGRPYSGSCGDGIVKLPEVCDEGTSLNGTPGHCNKTCSGYGSYCGDGTLTPLDESSLGCQCDSSITSASCSTGYRPIAGDACVNFNCSALPAHQWSCVANLEECENVIGLTSYSCPASEALYCDTSCNRACTSIDIDSSTGRRQNAAVYEHYFSSGTVEDNDYTLIKKADTPYATKAIVFYAYQTSVAGSIPIYRFKATAGADHRLSTSSSIGGYTSLGVEFEAFSATGTNRAPVYEFLSQSGTVPDYYYSRNNVPRIDNQNKPYVIQNNGNPVFWAMLGPFQETCGNGSIEGNETCEPSTYQTPTASQSSATQQYACGEPFTPNACRIYGGYCGDAAKDSPFEQCDEGSAAPFNCSVTTAVTCTSDANCQVSTCGRNIPGRCDLNNTISCSKDSNCPQNTCIGNGAQCNNNANNCTYCTATCSQAIVPRNYCGDGIVNCGLQTPTDCTDQDPYTEVCDDGTANNGKPGQCNETCTGRTGAVCGNNIREQTCNNDTSIACTVNSECPQPGGVCSGEVCDDGANNGRWTYTCRTSPGVQCLVDADCPNPNPAECTGEPFNYCSFSCLGRTPAVCGDSIVQQPNWGQDRIEGTSDDRNELCDSGIMNGTAGFCNTTCTGITPAVCGDGIVGSGTCDRSKDVFGAPQPCQTDAECTDFPNDFCRGGESCDPPASTTTQACTDAGKPGLQTSQCNSICQTVNTQCHAFGLKIWSDGVDVAYLNGSLMILDPVGAPACFADPDLQTADYSWPTSPPPPAPGVSSNQCTTPASQVPDQDKYAASDVRPINSSGNLVAGAFEINGKNVVAVKIWAKNASDPRSFQAVYTSPTANRLYPTTSGQSSPWACSHVFTPGWQKVSCPACDPTLSSGTWRRPFSYTGNPGTPLCNTNYTDQVGTTAQWIWGDDCSNADGDPEASWVYCRLEYISSGSPVQAAWNPNFGWVHMSTAGGGRVHILGSDPANNKRVYGAAWNRNLGWLLFDGDFSADGTANPIPLANRVTVDMTTGQLQGIAWGKNFGRVIFNPVDTCGGSICSDTGLACPPACSATATCDLVNCTQGYGLRSYQNTRRDPTSGVVTGYAWSEEAGWIDFSAYTQSSIYIPEY